MYIHLNNFLRSITSSLQRPQQAVKSTAMTHSNSTHSYSTTFLFVQWGKAHSWCYKEKCKKKKTSDGKQMISLLTWVLVSMHIWWPPLMPGRGGGPEDPPGLGMMGVHWGLYSCCLMYCWKSPSVKVQKDCDVIYTSREKEYRCKSYGQECKVEVQCWKYMEWSIHNSKSIGWLGAALCCLLISLWF